MNAPAKTKRPLVIFRDHLMYPSETFIREQAEALQGFTPHYVGSRRVPGLVLPEDRVLLLNSGGGSGLVSEALFKLFGVAPGMVRSLQKLDPVLLHAHFGPDGLRAVPLARALHKPLMVTFHGSDATMSDECARHSYPGQRAYVRRRKDLIHSVTRVLAVSNFIRERLLAQGFPPEKVVVHYVGVDTSRLRPDSSVNREPLVLFVGRLVGNKGCAYLMDAMAQVQKSYPSAELVIVGDGPLRTQLEQQARENLRSCRFTGVQTPAQVREWLKRASLFCVPSVTAPDGTSEGFGIVFAEAQSMAVPVVSFATGGVPEAVAHGLTGFLAPETDVNALAGYLSLLISDAELRRTMGAAGRQRVCQQFDLRKQTALLEKIYENVIAEAQ
jgi:glycosyltransferase involved in cell wall biosynthesis